MMATQRDKFGARLLAIQGELRSIELKLTTLIRFHEERIAGMEKHLGINKKMIIWLK